MWLIDEQFSLTRADGDVFGMEALFACSIKNDNLEKFLVDWEFWLSSAPHRPDDSMLEALFVRQLRQCTQFQTELRDYDRLPIGDKRRCYAELMSTARMHVKRVKLQKHLPSRAEASLPRPARTSTITKRKEAIKGKARAKKRAKEPTKGPKYRQSRTTGCPECAPIT